MLVGGRPDPLGSRHGAAPAVPSLVEDGGDRTRAAASRASNSPINDPINVASSTHTVETPTTPPSPTTTIS
ncbi:hypothetical protein OG785_35630 [Streptomyces sp. NBC_00006]|uniref:hypothetical protein n=1 Tax=Streptomyces sp. NBC_00006 TaxID=2975619 RepID=UPI002254634A|nr:hypothetical protein [Streptomyces sp. NBC_00006]MCX5535873.1 hypothetical protein [Streptomyces sp. NBC_00006]